MTLDEFKALHPDLNVNDSQIQSFLNLFTCVYTDDYGCMAGYLQEMFTMHMLKYNYINKGTGPADTIVTTKRVGDVSISNGSYLSFTGRDPSHFNYTKYGQQFVDMISPFGAGPMMAGEYYGG